MIPEGITHLILMQHLSKYMPICIDITTYRKKLGREKSKTEPLSSWKYYQNYQIV